MEPKKVRIEIDIGEKKKKFRWEMDWNLEKINNFVREKAAKDVVNFDGKVIEVYSTQLQQAYPKIENEETFAAYKQALIEKNDLDSETLVANITEKKEPEKLEKIKITFINEGKTKIKQIKEFETYEKAIEATKNAYADLKDRNFDFLLEDEVTKEAKTEINNDEDFKKMVEDATKNSKKPTLVVNLDPKPQKLDKINIAFVLEGRTKRKNIKEFETYEMAIEATKKLDPALQEKEFDFKVEETNNEIDNNDNFQELIEETNKKGAKKLTLLVNFELKPKALTGLTKAFYQALESNFKSEKGNLGKALMEMNLKKYQKQYDGLTDNLNGKEVHQNILCNVCCDSLKEPGKACESIVGSRFMCAECDNFNMCLKCERLENHNKDHFLIKFNKPVPEEYEFGYSSMIQGNNRTFTRKLKETITTEFVLINDGEKTWKDCFLLPIAYGEAFISGKKILCEKEVRPKQTYTFVIKDLKCNKIGEFDSKFRMFNEKGVPFGEVLYIHITVTL